MAHSRTSCRSLIRDLKIRVSKELVDLFGQQWNPLHLELRFSGMLKNCLFRLEEPTLFTAMMATVVASAGLKEPVVEVLEVVEALTTGETSEGTRNDNDNAEDS